MADLRTTDELTRTLDGTELIRLATVGANWKTTVASLETFIDPLFRQVADQSFLGGTQIPALALPAGNVTLDPGLRPQQYIPNTGAFTITAPANDGNLLLQIENGAGAGAVTFSGFTVGPNVGDLIDAVVGHRFVVSVWRIHGISSYVVKALQ